MRDVNSRISSSIWFKVVIRHNCRANIDNNRGIATIAVHCNVRNMLILWLTCWVVIVINMCCA